MKYLLLILLLAGCSTEDWRNGFAGAAAGNQAVQARQEKEPHGVDWTCKNRCTSSGYSWSFCNSKCSY